MKPSTPLLFTLGLLGVLLLSAAAPAALAQTPTPEQLKLLQQLTPEQRAAALEAYRKQQQGQVREQAPPQPEVVQPRPAPKVAPKPSPGVETRIEREAAESLDIPELAEKKEARAVHQKLKQFGYDLFAGAPTTFAPATDIPVPATYVIGPGDTVLVQLFGKENAEYTLVVSREGELNFPELGPISVAGLTFQEMKQVLLDRIANQMIGVKASITMGPLRSIRVFVLGDAYRPGSYLVSGLSTITHALFVSGGIRGIGSLRDIQLKRNGEVVTHLDLYDLLLRGDTSADERLLPGDVVFVPPIGPTAGIGGEVRRPAIYELRGEKTAGELLEIAGGLLPSAYPQASQIERISSEGERTLVDVDLGSPAGRATPIRDGDVVRVYSVLEKMEDIVLLQGHVERPGAQQWHPGMRLTELIPSIDDLLPKPDLHYVLIRRELEPDRRIQVLSADLGAALAKPGSKADPKLHRRDTVFVFSISENRARQIAPLIEELRQQATFEAPESVATIAGNVRIPGTYPLAPGMRVSALVRAARDLKPETDLRYGVLVRELEHGTRVEVHTFAPGLALGVPGTEVDPKLRPRDRVLIFREGQDKDAMLEPVLARLKQQATDTDPARIVGVSGLVLDPGTYPLEPGMQVSGLLTAAGRLRESAYTLQAEITRYRVVGGEYQEIAHIPVNLAGVLAGDSAANLFLEPHDHLNIKLVPEWGERETVEITGEVRFPGVYPITRGEQLSSVIRRAGGLTDLAYAEAAFFTRKELAVKEKAEQEKLARRLEADIAAASVQQAGEGTDGADQQQALAAARELLAALRAVQPSGRLVIDLPTILYETREGRRSDRDVTLQNGDRLVVPRFKQEVSVVGEVFHPTSHVYDEELDRDDYINLSGGMTKKADEDLIYIVRANGSVISSEAGSGFLGSTWWEREDAQAIKPGDTIVVPVDIERIRPLTLWSSVSQIVYQLAIAAASAKTVGAF